MSDPFGELTQQVINAAAAQQKATNPARGSLPLDIAGFNTGIPMPGWLSRGLAGAGQYGYNVARGVGERMGMVSHQQIAQDQKLDAPLNATTAGRVGNLLGGIGWTGPAMLIPGVNTVAGGALLGGALGATTPTAPGQSVLRNTVLGAGTGLLGNFIGEHAPPFLGKIVGKRAQEAVDAAAPYAERDAVLSAARDAGYKVAPTAVRRNVLTTALESVSGKAATRQSAEAVNQGVTDSLVARDLGLDPRAPISSVALASARKGAGAVYQQVADALPSFESDGLYRDAIASLGHRDPDLGAAYNGFEATTPQAVKDLAANLNVDAHTGPAAVKMSKALRAASKATFKRYFRSQDPSDLALAQAQRDGASALEGLIGRRLAETSGTNESVSSRLAQDWDRARTTIAKSYQAAGALKNGHINAIKLGLLLDRGAPMSGGMDLAGRFAQQFGDVARVPKSGPGVSKLSAMLGLAGEGGALYLHSPEAAALSAATMAAPYATRGAILSDLGQRLLATPKYGPSASVTTLLRGLRAGSPFLTRLALPALTGSLAK